ncbi:unnamed protein product [Cuscuta campestris]|uniref:Reverse transcriptase Ty1/copia-type domain-containing protein n=1 Tax=Cuscuta campestris TaxID=132261 RepID=A0A484M2M1_9ASTE|nr:unnamed protein product [Cuscuta campestris]
MMRRHVCLSVDMVDSSSRFINELSVKVVKKSLLSSLVILFTQTFESVYKLTFESRYKLLLVPSYAASISVSSAGWSARRGKVQAVRKSPLLDRIMQAPVALPFLIAASVVRMIPVSGSSQRRTLIAPILIVGLFMCWFLRFSVFLFWFLVKQRGVLRIRNVNGGKGKVFCFQMQVIQGEDLRIHGFHGWKLGRLIFFPGYEAFGKDVIVMKNFPVLFTKEIFIKAYRVFNKRTLTIEESPHIVFSEDNTRLARKAICDDLADSLERVHLEDDEEDTPLYTNPQPQSEETPQVMVENEDQADGEDQEEAQEQEETELPIAWRTHRNHPLDQVIGSINRGEFSTLMTSEFEMSMMGELTFFLGLQVKQMKDGTFICQAKYCKELLKRFEMDNAKAMATPMSTSDHLDKDEKDLKLIHAIMHSAPINWAKFVMINMTIAASTDHDHLLPYPFLVMDILERFKVTTTVGPLTKATKIWTISNQTFLKRSDNAAAATAEPRRTAPTAGPAEPQARANLASIADSLNRLHLKVDGMGGYLERLDVAVQRQGYAMNSYFQGINYVPPPYHGTFFGQVYGDEDEADDSYAPSSSPDEDEFDDAIDGDEMDVDDDEEETEDED